MGQSTFIFDKCTLTPLFPDPIISGHLENEGPTSVFSRPLKQPMIPYLREFAMSSSKFRNVFLSGLLFAMATNCLAGQADGNQAVLAHSIPLEGSNWQLVKLTVLGGYVFAPDDHSKYVLNFRSGNRLTGNSDCNSINGSWQQENNELHFEPFITTTSLCPPGSLHSYLVLYLKDVKAHSFRDGHLLMTTPTEGVEIEFESRD